VPHIYVWAGTIITDDDEEHVRPESDCRAARVYGIIFVGFTRESISPLVGAFAGNVNAVGDTNITQLFNIVDRLQRV
jgi:hypothetical protein